MLIIIEKRGRYLEERRDDCLFFFSPQVSLLCVGYLFFAGVLVGWQCYFKWFSGANVVSIHIINT